MSTPNDRPKVELPDLDFMFRDAAQVVRPAPTTDPAKPSETPTAAKPGDEVAESESSGA